MLVSRWRMGGTTASKFRDRRRMGWAGQGMPLIPAAGRLIRENHAWRQGYLTSPSRKPKKQPQRKLCLAHVHSKLYRTSGVCLTTLAVNLPWKLVFLDRQ